MHTAKIHRPQEGRERFGSIPNCNRRKSTINLSRKYLLPLSLKHRLTPRHFNYYHSHFCASRTIATAAERLHLLVPWNERICGITAERRTLSIGESKTFHEYSSLCNRILCSHISHRLCLHPYRVELISNTKISTKPLSRVVYTKQDYQILYISFN